MSAWRGVFCEAKLCWNAASNARYSNIDLHCTGLYCCSKTRQAGEGKIRCLTRMSWCRRREDWTRSLLAERLCTFLLNLLCCTVNVQPSWLGSTLWTVFEALSYRVAWCTEDCFPIISKSPSLELPHLKLRRSFSFILGWSYDVWSWSCMVGALNLLGPSPRLFPGEVH